MAKRRRIRGKKLLIVSASLGAAGFMACADRDRGPDPVANLLPPPDAGPVDAFMDAPVANLLPPPDAGFDASMMEDAASGDAGETSDADVSFLDAPVANLLPPPDGSF